MHVRTLALLSTFAAASMLLQGCGSSGGSTLIVPGPTPTGQPNPNPNPDPNGFIADSIGAMNAVGSPVAFNQDYNESIGTPTGGQSKIRQPLSLGQCVNRVRFSSPDSAGDPMSTERIVYFDNGCSQIAVDTVRKVTAGGPPGSTETVAVTTSKFQFGATTANAVRTDTVTYTGGTFDKYFFPNIAAGLVRSDVSQLAVAGVNTIANNSEFISSSVSGNVMSYCADWAGYNASGAGTTTYGWMAQTNNQGGTRTLNADGSETFAVNLQSLPNSGAVGSLSITTGTQNAGCPISAPQFSLAGGTMKGFYALPISMTFFFGDITGLSVVNAALSNGDTLNVQLSPGGDPASATYIKGALTNSVGPVSTFGVNAFGFGTLTVTAYGTPQKFAIVDWHVVQNFN